MVLKLIIRAILSRQSAPFIESLVDKLSNTRPIRRSAQIAAYLINRGSGTLKLNLQDFLKSDRFKAIKDKLSGGSGPKY